MSTLSTLTAASVAGWIARNKAFVTLTFTTVSGWATALSQDGGCHHVAAQAEWLLPTAAVLAGTWLGWVGRAVDAVRAGKGIPDVNADVTTEWVDPAKAGGP